MQKCIEEETSWRQSVKKYIKIDCKSMPEMLKKKTTLESIYEITVCILHAAYITAILCSISEYTMEITSQFIKISILV